MQIQPDSPKTAAGMIHQPPGSPQVSSTSCSPVCLGSGSELCEVSMWITKGKVVNRLTFVTAPAGSRYLSLGQFVGPSDSMRA